MTDQPARDIIDKNQMVGEFKAVEYVDNLRLPYVEEISLKDDVPDPMRNVRYVKNLGAHLIKGFSITEGDRLVAEYLICKHCGEQYKVLDPVVRDLYSNGVSTKHPDWCETCISRKYHVAKNPYGNLQGQNPNNDKNPTIKDSDLDKYQDLGKYFQTVKKCGNCSNRNTILKMCSGCKSIYYCDTKCQRIHWISTHKYTCVKK